MTRPTRPTYYGPGLAEYLDVPSWEPTNVAFACMLHIRGLEHGAYRTRKAQEASNRCEAASTLDPRRPPLLGLAEGAPGPI